MAKPILEFNGGRVHDLDSFWDEVSRALIPGAEWGRNLDAFNDILRGGFGTPEGGCGRIPRDVNADMRAGEFLAFRDALRRLYDQLADQATFETMEHWLRIAIVGDGRGHFEAKCELRDDPGMGSRLTFTLEFDQTCLPAMIRQLDAIVDAYPIIGKP